MRNDVKIDDVTIDYIKKLMRASDIDSVIQRITRYIDDVDIRVNMIKQYIKGNPGGTFVNGAGSLAQGLIARRDKTSGLLRKAVERKAHIKKAMNQQKLKLQRKEASKRWVINHLDKRRYKVNGDDTVTDSTTGLTWCLLDSYSIIKKCLKYNEARKYAQELRTGNFSNWRLPTANELVVIFKSDSAFPINGERWYWTSEMFETGIEERVNAITSKKEENWQRIPKVTDECGHVFTVR